MFYVVMYTYAGVSPLFTRLRQTIEIQTKPAVRALAGDKVAVGFCGTFADWDIHACGVHSTLEEAIESVKEQYDDAREVDKDDPRLQTKPFSTSPVVVFVSPEQLAMLDEQASADDTPSELDPMYIKDMLEAHIDELEQQIALIIPQKGMITSDCQLLTILSHLTQAGRAISSLEPEDFQPDVTYDPSEKGYSAQDWAENVSIALDKLRAFKAFE